MARKEHANKIKLFEITLSEEQFYFGHYMYIG